MTADEMAMEIVGTLFQINGVSGSSGGIDGDVVRILLDGITGYRPIPEDAGRHIEVYGPGGVLRGTGTIGPSDGRWLRLRYVPRTICSGDWIRLLP